MTNKTNTNENYKHYLGVCPLCNKENYFNITNEELKNNYTFSCEFCLSETDLNGYQLKEIKTAQELLNETPAEEMTKEERADLNINKVTHDKVKRLGK